VFEFLLTILIVLGLIGALVYVMRSKSRYEEMSDQEFEEEVRKGSGSLVGAAIGGLEGALRKREAAVMMEAKTRIEKGEAASTGKPPQEEGGDRPKE
jgi:hypothetical protein